MRSNYISSNMRKYIPSFKVSETILENDERQSTVLNRFKRMGYQIRKDSHFNALDVQTSFKIKLECGQLQNSLKHYMFVTGLKLNKQ